MLRLTEVKLPLDHTEPEIKAAILKQLQINPADLVKYSIFKRTYDARSGIWDDFSVHSAHELDNHIYLRTVIVSDCIRCKLSN